MAPRFTPVRSFRLRLVRNALTGAILRLKSAFDAANCPWY
jgi:hypothetical protein